MWQYTVKRLLLALPTLVGAALVVFLLMHVVPGDVALLMRIGKRRPLFSDPSAGVSLHLAPPIRRGAAAPRWIESTAIGGDMQGYEAAAVVPARARRRQGLLKSRAC